MSAAKQQRIALANPCFKAEDCMWGHYYRELNTVRGRLTVAVTVNVGDE